MNVLTDEIEEIAESIKLRMVARGGTWTVYVRDDGSMVMDRDADVRRSRPIPDSCILARYTKAIPVADIEDDLVCRMNEIRALMTATGMAA